MSWGVFLHKALLFSLAPMMGHNGSLIVVCTDYAAK